MRTVILWIVITVLVGIGSLQAGYIVGNRQILRQVQEDRQWQSISLEERVRNHEGRIVILEGPPKGKVKIIP